MGRHTYIATPPRVPSVARRGISHGRHNRSRHSLPVFAFATALAFVLVTIVDPYSGAFASTTVVAPSTIYDPPQTLVVADGQGLTASREAWSVSKPAPKPAPAAAAAVTRSSGAPAAGTPDPGSAKAIALDMVLARGWGQDQYDCLVSLWNKESGWNVYAHNRSSGAYGIPQALPGNKMGSAGADWMDNPATQITWGLGYISGRYSTPCGAWGHSQSVGWY